MSLLKSIPKIDKFVSKKSFDGYSINLITKISQVVIENLRSEILQKNVSEINEDKLVEEVLKTYEELVSPSLQKVINATGIIVHTN
ncbi:MAG: L-seryl-tRNA(Sec) selenium transferase, partial [Arcobacter sp.]